MAGGGNKSMNPPPPMKKVKEEVIDISDSSTENNMVPLVIVDDAVSSEMASLSRQQQQQPKPENNRVVVEKPFTRSDARKEAALRRKNRGKRPRVEDCHPSVVKIKMTPPISKSTFNPNNITDIIYRPEYMEPIGVNCWICNMDLMFSPEMQMSHISTAPPQTAILGCGHAFHNYCLMMITPTNQQMNPTCPPCYFFNTSRNNNNN